MGKENLSRKNISIEIFKKIGFSKNFSLKLVDDFFEIMSFELIKLNKIKISSFGTFSVINKNERIGRNPKTKVSAKITARKIVKFKPAATIKKKINQK